MDSENDSNDYRFAAFGKLFGENIKRYFVGSNTLEDLKSDAGACASYWIVDQDNDDKIVWSRPN